MNPAIKFFSIFIVLIIIILGILYVSRTDKENSFWKPVSVVSKVAKEVTDLKSSDGRTNILLLGMDKRSPGNTVTSTLTDTIMIISVDKKAQNPVIISLPRDLWVGTSRSKLNAVYNLTRIANLDEADPHQIGIDAAKSAIEEILGIPIHYYALVGFDGFQEAIDAVGGIDVNVENTFVDNEYPVEGKENAIPESDRYMTVSFNQGIQKMDGETALKYARSRHSTNPIEAGDFARARRQQQVLLALKDKAMSSQTFFDVSKITALYDSFSKNVKTDMSLTELLVAYKNYNNIEIGEIQKLVLSDGNKDAEKLGSGTLKAPTIEEREAKYNGQYVLIPQSTTYDEINALVRSVLFGESVNQSDTIDESQIQ